MANKDEYNIYYKLHWLQPNSELSYTVKSYSRPKGVENDLLQTSKSVFRLV